jgi:hypothetical protein
MSYAAEHDKAQAEVIVRYMRDKYGYESNVAEYLRLPRPERTWAHKLALAYFRERNHFERLEDAPDGFDWITVADGERVRNYQWRISYPSREWHYVLMNDMTRRDFDLMYGD